MNYFLINFPRAVNTVRRSEFAALSNISFEVYEGETFGVIGWNRAGDGTTGGLIASGLRSSKGEAIEKGRVLPREVAEGD